MPIKYGANGLHDGTDETKELAFDVTGVTTGTTRTVTVPNANVDLPEINLTATSNIGLGTGAVDAITTGNYNVGLGNNALTAETTGSNNTAVGSNALALGAGSWNNVAVGYNSLDACVTGQNNVSVGSGALSSSTASNNTAVGNDALNLNTTGTQNVAVGAYAGDAITTGSEITAVGYNAGGAVTTLGARSAFFGYNAGAVNNGTDNLFCGYKSGQSYTGINSCFVGSLAGQAATSGASNTFIGTESGYSVTTGDENTFVGRGAGYYMTTGSNNSILGRYNGNQGGLDIRTASNYIVLSDGDGNPRFIVDSNGRAQLGGTTGSYTAQLTVKNTVSYTLSSERTGTGSEGHVVFSNGNGAVGSIFTNGTSTAYNTSSDYRLKENVTDITDGIDRLKQLSVHKFNFISDPDTTIDGFLAHEAQVVVPEAVTGTKDEVDDEGNPVYQGIDQSKLVPLLTAALKEAITEIESLKARVETLENA